MSDSFVFFAQLEPIKMNEELTKMNKEPRKMNEESSNCKKARAEDEAVMEVHRRSGSESFKLKLLNSVNPGSWTRFGSGKEKLKINQRDIVVVESPSSPTMKLSSNDKGSKDHPCSPWMMVSYRRKGRPGGYKSRCVNQGRNMKARNGSLRWMNGFEINRTGNFGSGGDGIKAVFDKYNKKVAASVILGRGKVDNAGGSRFDVLNENMDEIQAHSDDANRRGGISNKKVLVDIFNRDKLCDDAKGKCGKLDRSRTNKGKLKGSRGNGQKKSVFVKRKAQEPDKNYRTHCNLVEEDLNDSEVLQLFHQGLRGSHV
ncbi:hypothetical protein ACOSQ3_014327 [Xanthoceras sorbifolium]